MCYLIHSVERGDGAIVCVCFQVDNRYVLKKIKVLLLPVAKKDWYRLPSEDEVKDDVSTYLPAISARVGRGC